MGVLPIQLIKQNLGQVDVFLEDINNEFIVVQDLPDTFSQGRSTFKIFGSDFLKKGVELKLELLDKAGDTVYIAPIRYRYNNQNPTLPYTYVSVEVYGPKINTGGVAELVILGELDSDKIEIPSEYIGRYNVRYRKNINLDLSKTVNTAPILFYKKPTVKTTEFVTKRLVPRSDNSTITKIISGSGVSGFSLNAGDRYYPDPTKTVDGTVGETPPNTDATDTQTESPSIKEAPGGDFKQLDNLKAFKTGEVKKPAVLKKVNRPELFTSSEPPVMKIFATGSGTFTSDMVGGEIRIPKEKIFVHNPIQFIGDGNVGIGTGFGTFPEDLTLAAGDKLEGAKIFIPDYTGSIERVINDKEIHVKEPFYFQYGDGVNTKYYLANFGNAPGKISEVGPPRSDFTMSFIETVSSTTSSFAFDSSLEFNIKNLRTFSGDVYKLRISGGSKTQVSDFPILLDTTIESPELLIDSTSPTGFLRSGYIQNQTHLDKYWSSSSNLTATFRSSNIIDSVHLSGSLTEKNASGRFSLKTDYAFELNKDVVYELKMNVVGIKGAKKTDTSQDKKAILKFHISGSNIPSDKNPKYTDANSFGKTINDEFGNVVGLELDSNSPDEFDYGRVSHTFKMPFKANRVTNTDTILQFRVEAGEWDISDISLRPAMDTGFSPDNVKVRVPVPTNTQRPDKFQFILQYYDVNNNEAEEVTFIDDVDVQGESLLIQGDDNLVKGTVTIGNVQGEGVEIKGGNSAFIRAVGYTGFTDARAGTGGGFFLWSGSVAPGGETQDNYNGAGLEIHDGNTGANESFFKFRTDDADNDNNSTFDIRTSRFFLGSTSQFVSGSLGNIEISSSNFHLQNDGDVVMQGTITAEAGGTIGGFNINANELQSDSGLLILRGNNGQITGSQVLFTGGTIGGFTLGSDTITGGKLVLDADGTIRSSDFEPNRAGSGFRLTAANGGMLEVESAKIRGTLKTTTFEKETVNAVGGQLYVANSTVLTSSAVAPNFIHTANQTTMSVENASGFVEGEIALIKKVDPTGFSTEYILIESSSRNDPSSDTDSSGNLFVQRGLGAGLNGISGSLGDAPATSQSYSGSQVIVSTGKLNTGFMRLNANPNDLSTPFMDIVERTGSGIFDVELKTRLGDLSGVAGTRNIPAGFTGFGLMTETAFLSGSNIKLEAPRFLLGDLNSTFVSGSNRNIEISSSRFHLQPDGDTILQGKVTATSGQVGGFDISENEISSSGMSMDSANQVLIFRDVNGSTLGTAGAEALRISFDGNSVIPDGNTTTTGERARIHVPSGSLAASDLVINTEVLNNVRIVPGRLRCFRKEGSGAPSDGNGRSILTPSNLGNNFNKHLDASAYFPNSNRDGSFSDLDFNCGVLGYSSRATNSSTSRQVALYGLSNVGAGAISIYGEVLQETGGYSGIFHGGQFVVGDVIGTGGSGADSTTDSDFVFVAYPNDIDGGTYSSYKGRVGINKRLPASALDVNGQITTNTTILGIEGSEDSPSFAIGSFNDGFFHDGGIKFVVNDDAVFFMEDGGHFHADNDVTAFSNSVASDKRLKEDIKPLQDNLNKILELKPSSFVWKIRDKQNDVGLIAQDVEKIIPEVVKENISIGKTKKFLDGDNHKTVDYAKITTYLIGAVQEQQKQIDELKKKLEEL